MQRVRKFEIGTAEAVEATASRPGERCLAHRSTRSRLRGGRQGPVGRLSDAKMRAIPLNSGVAMLAGGCWGPKVRSPTVATTATEVRFDGR